MLQHSTQIDARSMDGLTPLHLAVAGQNMSLAKLLLSYGADRCTEMLSEDYSEVSLSFTSSFLALVQHQQVYHNGLLRLDDPDGHSDAVQC